MEYLLEKGEVVSLAATGGGKVLQTVSGTLWLTGSPDQQDHILTPGRRFRLEQAESVVIEALEDASFSVAAAEALAPLRFVIRLNGVLPARVPIGVARF